MAIKFNSGGNGMQYISVGDIDVSHLHANISSTLTTKSFSILNPRSEPMGTQYPLPTGTYYVSIPLSKIFRQNSSIIISCTSISNSTGGNGYTGTTSIVLNGTNLTYATSNSTSTYDSVGFASATFEISILNSTQMTITPLTSKTIAFQLSSGGSAAGAGTITADLTDNLYIYMTSNQSNNLSGPIYSCVNFLGSVK